MINLILFQPKNVSYAPVITLNGFLPKKPKPKIKPEFCAECAHYSPHSFQSRCKIGVNLSARAWSRSCKQSIFKTEAKRSF